jgi:hypothetical protein
MTLAILILLFCGVQTANALGRSSGGRYIVPVDWLILLFYFAGLLYLMGKLDLNEILVDGNKTGKFIGWKQLLIAIISIFLIGALPVVFERISIAFIPRAEKIQSVEQLANLSGSTVSSQDITQIGRFLNQPSAISLQGSSFYPIQQNIENVGVLPLAIMNNYQGSVLSFHLLASKNNLVIYFPFQDKVEIQNQDEVYLIGCRIRQIILIHDMIIIHHDKTQYLQSNLKFDSCDELKTSN